MRHCYFCAVYSLCAEQNKVTFVSVVAGDALTKPVDMSSPEEPRRPQEPTEPLCRVVELARDVLRERGLTEEQIDVLLRRTRAPDDLR